MKSIIIFFSLFLGFTFFSFAQRPLQIDKVRPIIDSVQNEINILYGLSEATNKSFELIKENNLFNQKTYNYLSYLRKDTVCFILIDTNKVVFSAYYSFNNENKLLAIDSNIYTLSENEKKLLNAKQLAISEAKKEKYKIKPLQDSKIEYIFYPNSEGFTLYAITIPLIDSILPFGNNYQFLFEKNMEIISFNKIGKNSQRSIRKKDNPPNSTLLTVSAPTAIKTNNFKILVPYYYKFRRYHNNLRLTKLNTSINKRILTYDAVKNEISIKLFPIERRHK
jgi:hypothetical protein